MVKKSSEKAKEQDQKTTEELNETTEQPTDVASEADETTDKEEIAEEQGEADQLKQKVAELNDKYVRLSAEFDNYRRRTLKEKMELTKTAGESLLLALLPVIDDFDRALAHVDEAKDIEALKDGIKLIHNKFADYLKQQGMKEIEAKDKPFDTDLHEAITKIPAPADEMKGKVIDCVEKGYTLHEKVVRFSKVVVGE